MVLNISWDISVSGSEISQHEQSKRIFIIFSL